MPNAAPRDAARSRGLDERSSDDRRAFASQAVAPRRAIGERIAVVRQKSIFNSADATATGHADHNAATQRDGERTRQCDPETKSLPPASTTTQYFAIVFEDPETACYLKDSFKNYTLTLRSTVG
jgi:hypothetical protein